PSARPLVWEHLTGDETHISALVSALGIDPVIAHLLVLRGIAAPDKAERFLHPSIDHLHDPFQLADLPLAVDRLLRAIDRKERIAVHGDYDVDGVTSTVILRRLLELLGADVVHFIPDRIKDGYGLEPAGIERLAAQQVSVVVSVDCGIRSGAAATRARELGLDLVITDHHEPDATLPPALAVINPKRPDCPYPDKDLAGVGVALKLVQALCQRTDHTRWLPGFIKMAALGTVADVVPLRGENRVIAKLGLDQLSRGPHTTGLRALLDSTGLLGQTLNSFHIAFRLAPRINAAGRMSTPDLAARLLLLADEGRAAEAKDLAEQLDTENLRRQQEETDVLTAARRRVDTDPDVGAHAMLVVWGEGWHRGVIGIVAAKLVDAFHRPAIVLAIDGDLAYGSGRSIPGFDLLDALEHCGDLFTRFGGHRHAAGLTIETGRLKALRTRLTAFADDRLGPDDLTPRLRIDRRLPLAAITPAVVEGLRAMEPFGAGNPRPVFHTGPVELARGPRVMKSRHLSMAVRQDTRVFRAVAWRMAERAEFVTRHGDALDVAFNLTENHYRGEHTVELSVADIRQAR
ncbi:MAG: single-stranded-DNA-specific exonuclease RecJ, partial [Acidobacteriota bacterium]|nr:single-stranded-DNA-specific exonuclease RecJ [Acidobacteriota bacterium]